jgi:pimeloyl-ACP methyl ester carboxylesterase
MADTTGRGRRLATAVAALALAAAACSGSGGSKSDPLAGNSFEIPAGEKLLQFAGAGGKVRIGATLTMPDNAKGPVPAVLIVPGPGLTNRDGLTVGAPMDSLYKDLSKAFTAAGMATFRYDHRGVGASTLEAGDRPTWDDMVTDAQEALKYLAQRGEIDGSRLAVAGHDLGGTIALKLAANDSRVRSVALVGVPGRPLVDVWAEQFKSLNGQESSDAFRTLVANLLATGSFPPRDAMRPEFQTMLPSGQDVLYKGLFSADPLADAPAVKVPVVIALGDKSTSVSTDDASRLGQALGGTSEVVVAPGATVTLQTVKPSPRPQAPADPSDMSSHGGGPPIADAPRDQPTVARVTSFLAASLGARAA